ncbi:hypothetical protein CISIN_1g048095mg [Citrus sinensis]|uniref:FRIGIDA-like protein n=1 Tax=Citrus sinensis TaxID=2711 RepID=A0A067DU51_CITSI|nr:hypothetical protein CISIN_1g048095mg [Citrus sinensis]
MKTRTNEIRGFNLKLQCKERQLRFLEKRIGESKGELALVQKEIEECNSELWCKEKELGLVQKRIRGCNGELQSKQGELALVEKEIEESNSELQSKEIELGLLQKRVGECNCELECKQQQLGLAQSEEDLLKNSLKNSIEHWSQKLNLTKEELSLLQKSIRECKGELDSKERQLAVVQKRIGECNNELQLKENELNLVKTVVEHCLQKLNLKKEELSLLQKSNGEWNGQLECGERQLELRLEPESGIKDCSQQIELKEKKLRQIQSSIEECEKELAIKERHISDYEEKLKAKEKLYDEIKKSIKELESAKKELEQPKSLTDNEETRLLSLQSMNNGRSLQLILNQHLQKHDLIFGQISQTLTKACDPALLVLDAMQGFYPPHSRKGDMEFDVSIIKRTCILLLEQLSNIAPDINPQVRDEAMKMAGEWKKKMGVIGENSLEVLGFLHLLAAYRLAPAFDGNELESLLDIVAHYRQTAKLRQSLGFADKVTVVPWSSIGMDQAENSRMNHGIGPAVFREQLQLQNYNKRPRMEPSTK